MEIIMATFHCLIKGTLTDAGSALAKLGLDGYDAVEHPNQRVTLKIKAPDHIEKVLHDWFLQTQDDRPPGQTYESGALLFLKKLH
jgi:hypothetical protein